MASHASSSNSASSSNGVQIPTFEELGTGADQIAAAAKNPELMQRMVSSALDTVTIEDVNRQRQSLNGAHGQKVMAALKKKGIKPAQLRKQILSSKNERGKEIHVAMQGAPLVIILRANKTLSKHVMAGGEAEFIKNSTGSDAVTAPCTALSSDGSTIFFCSEPAGKVNKRATAMIGYPVYGQVLFARKEGDLTVDEFTALENSCTSR